MKTQTKIKGSLSHNKTGIFPDLYIMSQVVNIHPSFLFFFFCTQKLRRPTADSIQNKYTIKKTLRTSLKNVATVHYLGMLRCMSTSHIDWCCYLQCVHRKHKCEMSLPCRNTARRVSNRTDKSSASPLWNASGNTTSSHTCPTLQTPHHSHLYFSPQNKYKFSAYKIQISMGKLRCSRGTSTNSQTPAKRWWGKIQGCVSVRNQRFR